MAESYCFHHAFIRTRPPHADIEIDLLDDEGWMAHLVAHMRGVRHPADAQENLPYLATLDPIGNSIRTISLKEGYLPLDEQETKTYQALLVSCLRGEVARVKETIDKVRSLRDPYLNPMQPIAAIAAKKVHIELLKFAFERGAQLDGDVCLAVKQGANSNEGKNQSYMQDMKAAAEKLESPPDQRDRGFDPGNRFDDIDW